VEVHVPRDDSADAVLAHQDGGVGVVHEVSGEMRHLGKDPGGDRGMPVGGHQHAEARGLEQRRHERPRLPAVPRVAHDAGVGRHAHELIEDVPGEVPRVRPTAPGFERFAAAPVEGGIQVRRVHEDVGIDDEHQRPSIAW